MNLSMDPEDHAEVEGFGGDVRLSTSMPTGGGDALELTVASTSRGEQADSYPTGGGEMLIDLSAGDADAVGPT